MALPLAARTCRHSVAGGPPVCFDCQAYDSATAGSGASFPFNDTDMQHYLRSRANQAQGLRDLRALQAQRATTWDIWYGGRAVADSIIYANGQPRQLRDYPYPTTLQSDEGALPVGPQNYQQVGPQVGRPTAPSQPPLPARQVPRSQPHGQQPAQVNPNAQANVQRRPGTTWTAPTRKR